MAEEVDARGLSCPQPMLLTRKALQAAGSGEVVVLVDTQAQVETCTRAGEKLGWKASCAGKERAFELRFRK